jgi:hypothetical protein
MVLQTHLPCDRSWIARFVPKGVGAVTRSYAKCTDTTPVLRRPPPVRPPSRVGCIAAAVVAVAALEERGTTVGRRPLPNAAALACGTAAALSLG